jgi:hypothetical protein
MSCRIVAPIITAASASESRRGFESRLLFSQISLGMRSI